MTNTRFFTATRSTGLLAGLSLAAVLAGAGLAWACLPQARLVTVQPRSSGPAGSEVTVAALGFDPGRAEIRWNAPDGELLASPSGPDFSVKVTIPQAMEGLYHLIVLARAPGGEIGNTAAVAFEVSPPGGAPGAGSPQPPPSDSPGQPTGLGEAALTVAGGGAGGALVAVLCLGGIVWLRGRAGRTLLREPPTSEG